MDKKTLLKEILRYMETKHKRYFTYEDILVYLYYRYRRDGISFSGIMRKLRLLANQGFLLRRYQSIEGSRIGKKVVFYPYIPAIRAYLRGLKVKKLI